MYSPTSQYLKTRFRWEAMGLSGMGWETWCPPPSSWSFPRQKRRLSPFLATKSVALGQRYTSLISSTTGPFFSVTGSTCTTLTQVMWQSLSRQQVVSWSTYRWIPDEWIIWNLILMMIFFSLWLSTTGAACHCIFYWKFPAMIHSLVEKEVSKGIPSSKIVLGGFSQVGAVFSLVNFLKFFPLIILIECCHQNFNN